MKDFLMWDKECVCVWASFQFHIILQGKTATYNLTTFMRVNITDGFTITSNESISEAAVRRKREREKEIYL